MYLTYKSFVPKYNSTVNIGMTEGILVLNMDQRSNSWWHHVFVLWKAGGLDLPDNTW